MPWIFSFFASVYGNCHFLHSEFILNFCSDFFLCGGLKKKEFQSWTHTDFRREKFMKAQMEIPWRNRVKKRICYCVCVLQKQSIFRCDTNKEKEMPPHWNEVKFEFKAILFVCMRSVSCATTRQLYTSRLTTKTKRKKKTTEKRDDGIALSWKIPATSLLKWHTLLAFFFFSSIY